MTGYSGQLDSLAICHIGSKFGLYGDAPHEFYAEVKKMEALQTEEITICPKCLIVRAASIEKCTCEETGAEWIIRLQNEKKAAKDKLLIAASKLEEAIGDLPSDSKLIAEASDAINEAIELL